MNKTLQACTAFLTTGEIQDEILVAYDQAGKKIPANIMPIWEPDEFVGEMPPIPEDKIWEEVLPELPGPPRLHDELPGQIEISRLTREDPDGKTRFLGTVFHEGDQPLEIPYHHINGFVIAITAESVSAPNLETLQGDLFAPCAQEAQLPNLQESANLLLPSAQVVVLDQLKRAETLEIPMREDGRLPALEEAGAILMPSAREIDLPKLKKCEELMGLGSRKASLPELVSVEGDLDLDFAKTIHAPKLMDVGGCLHTESAKSFQPTTLRVGGVWMKADPKPKQGMGGLDWM